MTDAELSAIESRANEACTGPWHANGLGDGTVEFPDGDHAEYVILSIPKHGASKYQCCRDAEFIAHARSDVPALIAEVRRLRGELEVVAPALLALGHEVKL